MFESPENLERLRENPRINSLAANPLPQDLDSRFSMSLQEGLKAHGEVAHHAILEFLFECSTDE
jgi:hypothetical protein